MLFLFRGALILSFFVLLNFLYIPQLFSQVLPLAKEKEKTPELLSEFYWVRHYLEDDDHKTLEQMAKQIQQWQERERFVDDWSLEFTNIYKVPDKEDQAAYIRKNAFTFLDRRISKELKKKDEKNEALVKMGAVREAITPNSELELNPNFRLRFSARPLIGKATLRIINPYANWWADYYAKGLLNVYLEKELQLFDFDFKTVVNYTNDQHHWVAAFNKQLADNLEGRLSSTQDVDMMAFSSVSDKKIEIVYKKVF